MKISTTAQIPLAILRKGVIPSAFLAALSSPLAYNELERWEGNILHVYADKLANGIPTYCAGRTDWSAKVGTKITSDTCKEVNKTTLMEYGYSVLSCANWDHITPNRLIGMTMFAINVGKQGACNSSAMKQINYGNIKAGCDLIAFKQDGTPNWSYSSGKYVQGLFNRRRAERLLCLG